MNTVRELMEWLSGMPADAEVLLEVGSDGAINCEPLQVAGWTDDLTVVLSAEPVL